ncbi:MAG TPA: type I DNA topoisomerase [Firmicutes bacterium]|nr:type I DNA topoisomerase [Bacillota bacterium]
MSNTLVIVESPAKAKTIGKFLGRGYTIKATMGHVRDLPRSQMGIDIENGFTPKYITIRGRGKSISELKEAARSARGVLLATDPDREGEAISWHLTQVLDIDETKPCRIEFHEITKKAVLEAVKNPRAIDMNRVNAQQARRILDRLVGYKLSPLLWKKVRRGLSAGRVQSVAVRLICDREREIEEFVPEEYWSIEATFRPRSKQEEFTGRLVEKEGKKLSIKSESDASRIIHDLEGASYEVAEIKRKERRRYPAPPFTTSTLQQEASRRFGFGSRKTMSIAQQLYEGLDIGEEGSVGLVTYIRTDSVRIAEEAIQSARSYILQKFGKDFLPPQPHHYKSKETSQDAHEAIRPTNVLREPESIKPYVTRDQYRLYKLIWERFIASQMEAAVYDVVSVDITAKDYLFRATGQTVKFMGFIVLYIEGRDDEAEEREERLPELSEGETLVLVKLNPLQHFTQPPSRYTEAMLVKALEEKGIGRPSTYAPIIDTIIKRGYVYLEDRRFRPTELGIIVVDLLKEYFPAIIDVQFTANMESQLDKIAEGESEWVRVVDEFYRPFQSSLRKAEEAMEKVVIPDKTTDELCPECGRNLVIKHGRYGEFLACPGFPECKFTKKITREIGVDCPKCGSPIVERRTKKGRKFYGCSAYPNCDFVVWNQPVAKTCPQCGEILVKKHLKGGTVYECSREGCNYREDSVS